MEITKAVYERVPVLVDENKVDNGNPWGVRFKTMFHMSNDSGLFRTKEQLEADGWVLEGNIFRRGRDKCLPLYEAKLIHQFDHRWATYITDDDIKDLTIEEKYDPNTVVMPRYWVADGYVEAAIGTSWPNRWFLTSRMMARSTDERTVIASVVPYSGVGNSASVWQLDEDVSPIDVGCLIANLNSFALDFVVQQKVGGPNLNFFIVRQFPIQPPMVYEKPSAWSPHARLADWFIPYVLELIYTTQFLQPFAKDLGYDGPSFRWDEERRFLLRCELDAAFFCLYGMDRYDVDYIMDTFQIVKRKDEQTHGEYRTKQVILEIYDQMHRAMETGRPYETRLDPPPADRGLAHSENQNVIRRAQ